MGASQVNDDHRGNAMNTVIRVTTAAVIALGLIMTSAVTPAVERDENSAVVSAPAPQSAAEVRSFDTPVRPGREETLFGVKVPMPQSVEEMAAVYERDGGC